MKINRKTLLTTLLCILAVFALLNVGWYFWRTIKYGSYIKGMEKNYFSTWMVPRYKYSDADRFDYGVKYPEYLSFTGNMSVGLPVTTDNPFTDFLIVWPKVTGGYQYGVSLTYNDTGYQIYINADGSAVDPKDSEIVNNSQETIQELLSRANTMWNLK